ncbi:MAG: polysaccharide pyruvyl transferase family protein [Thermoguttaceae bacterium]|nr:polysaccharide pyruvyl transferase family protein [Thermoguttaceae bacterium]
MTPVSAEQSDSPRSEIFRGHSAGIATFMSGKNYGCDLQRYALQRVLRKFGLRALLINYVPPLPARGGFSRRIFRARHLISLAKGAVWFLDRRDAAFRRFAGRYLETTEPIGDDRELARRAVFDCYVAGSDQIWNPTISRVTAGLGFFTLDFAPSGKKISYAPSLGVSRIDPSYAERLKRSLSSFDWISVREKEGAEILRTVLGRPVDVVLDPTMLLTPKEWDAVADEARPRSVQKKKYIFCYSLGNTPQVLDAARRLASAYNATVAAICYSPFDALRLKRICPYCRPVLNAGPAEFVSLIRSAECVVTDSFHGTVFSILYHRPFRTMMRDRRDGASSMNSRVKTLLETFGLESRLFDPADFSPGEAGGANFAASDEILLRCREDSLKKLERGLRKVLIDEKSSD